MKITSSVELLKKDILDKVYLFVTATSSSDAHFENGRKKDVLKTNE